jgi:hypothetical protein
VASGRRAGPALAATLYFAEGQKEGIKIPLAFDITQAKDAGLATVGGLEATDNGLIFIGQGSSQGFWGIPWSDIDACRAKAHPTAAASALPKPAQ